MKVCFSSVCTDDSYSYYIPLFVYSVKKAYPDAGVKVLVKGKLKQEIRDALDLIPFGGWEVKDGYFKAYPNKAYACSSLRFLVNEREYKGYDYVFVKDIDFLIFSHKISHLKFFRHRMKTMPYFGCRGPYRHPRRYDINGRGWKGMFTRIAGGSFAFKNPAWFDKTREYQKKYRGYIKRDQVDGIDSHKPASYREYDEVMLFRIAKKAGLRTPRRKNKDIFGNSVPKRYRDIHMGDFTKKKHGNRRLARRVATENLKKFIELEEDPVWIEISRKCSKSGKIREVLRRVRKYAKRQLNLSSSSVAGTAKKPSKSA